MAGNLFMLAKNRLSPAEPAYPVTRYHKLKIRNVNKQ